MAYQIYFSNPNEFLRNLIIAILRIKKHSKTITDKETKLLEKVALDNSSEPVVNNTPQFITPKSSPRKPNQIS